MSKTADKKILPPLKGEPATLRQDEFRKLGEFLYYEGPLISHFVNLRNEDFIMKWCGKDHQFNRWLLYKTNYGLLHRFFEGEIGDMELVLQNPDGHVFFIDIDNDIHWKNTVKVEIANIPVQYLPTPTAFYGPGDFEPYGENLRTYLHLHFGRLNTLYKLPEPPATLFAEPPPPEYRKQ